MVGATYHVACLQKPAGWPAVPKTCVFAAPGEAPNDPLVPLTLDQMVDDLAEDAISPVIHRLLFADIQGLVWPFPLRTDRGQGLEVGWRNQLHRALDQPLAALEQGEKEKWRPTLGFSPMLVEDGRRLLISNDKLDFLAWNRWPSLDHGSPGTSESTPALQFRELFPKAVDFRLSTAARMSASFLYVSPAAVLPTAPRRRVVDAGYFDNYGIDLATSWLYENAQVLPQSYGKVVLIQIRDGFDEKARQDPAEPPDKSIKLQRGLEWLLSPPEAALAARTAVMSYRNDRQLQMLSVLLNGLHGKDFFTTVLFQNRAEVSMSWYVPLEEKKKLRHVAHDPAGEVQQRVGRLKAWWSSPGSGPHLPSFPGNGGG
jgi:hypothetical protein